MRRRTFVATAGSGVSILAGCVEPDEHVDPDTSTNDDDGDGTDRSEGTDSDTSNGSGDPEHDVETRYQRGGASPTSIEFEPHEPTRDLGPEDHEYDEAAEVVRIDYRNTTGEMGFDEFAETRTTRAVRRDLRSRFEEAGIDSGVRVGRVRGPDERRLRESDLEIAIDDYDQVVQVSHVTVYNEDWEEVYDPDVAFGELVAVVPARYDTRTEFASREYTAEVAVVCFRGAEREIEDEE